MIRAIIIRLFKVQESIVADKEEINFFLSCDKNNINNLLE